MSLSERPKRKGRKARPEAPKIDFVPLIGPDGPGRIDVPLPQWARIFLVDEHALNLFSKVCFADACVRTFDDFLLEFATVFGEHQKTKILSMRSKLCADREDLRLELENRILGVREGVKKLLLDPARKTGVEKP